MNITKDTVVTLSYRVLDAQGKLLEASEQPMAYLHGGYGNTFEKIETALEGAKNADGSVRVNGIFAAVPYCIDLIGGPYLETDPEVCDAFRPKAARRTY